MSQVGEIQQQRDETPLQTQDTAAMAFSSAIGRLSVLSQHLAADSEQGTLQRQETRADEDVRPAPGGGPGTLTVLDNRTGKKYTVRLASKPMRLSKSAAVMSMVRGLTCNT